METSGTSIKFCAPAKVAYSIVEQFEDEFKAKIGAKHCVAVNSGGTALFLALKALGIGKGDEVIIPEFTMVATANAVVECGAKPVFVDVEDNGNIDVSKIQVTKKTKAIIPVHIYGHPADMADLKEIGIPIVEDAAEAHGAVYGRSYAGTLGRAGCFSFYSNKIISTGEGGAVVTDDKNLAEELRQLRSYKFGPAYWHSGIGYGMRMNPYGAAHGLSELKEWDKHIERRTWLAGYYDRNIKVGMGLPTKPNVKHVHWMYGRLVEKRDDFMLYLKEHGIETRHFFRPMTMQPMFKGKTGRRAKWLYEHGVLLPSMCTDEEAERIVKVCNDY
jgi:perosamine synthetase